MSLIDDKLSEKTLESKDKSIETSFKLVSKAVIRHLEIAMTEENSTMFTTPMKTTLSTKRGMNDFATDDFLEKNIRVMPGSFANTDLSALL